MITRRYESEHGNDVEERINERSLWGRLMDELGEGG